MILAALAVMRSSTLKISAFTGGALPNLASRNCLSQTSRMSASCRWAHGLALRMARTGPLTKASQLSLHSS